jgi:catalase
MAHHVDVRAHTFAKLFEAGKETPIACRWSTVIHSKGSPEFLRDPRGFAIKFYTEEGNYDIVGLNFPIFFIRDGIRFPDMIRSLKPNPING